MSKIIINQMKIGEVDISCIKFDLKSRDEIPKLLMGLQAIYCNPEMREKVFTELEKAAPEKISKTTGRSGMELWTILVLGTLRLNCKWDYDKGFWAPANKEPLEMVLLDDNFATIEASVEEGRVIYDNIKKFISYSVAGNIGKVIVMLTAPIFGTAVALMPLQLLWLNLITDGFLGLGLGMEPGEKGIMKRPPRQSDETVFGQGAGIRISWIGIVIGIATLLLGWIYYEESSNKWQTIMFTVIAFLQIGQALASKSTKDSFFSTKFNSNPTLTLMILLLLSFSL